ncbi:MAG: chloride channel protein [Cytophagales bacterium]|nr:chloride channel protein [Cytophagales bacterium]
MSLSKKAQSKFVRSVLKLKSQVGERNFLIICSVIIGLIAGLAAVSLKTTVHYIHHFLIAEDAIGKYDYYYATFPIIGLILTVIISRNILKDPGGHGVTQVLWNIAKGNSKIKGLLMTSRMITSAITVGLGGSVGLESPIVVTGSAIGSNIGILGHLGYKYRTLLIGCGAAAAVSGIFNSPIAGVIFAAEVIFHETKIDKFIPLLIASSMGSLVAIMLGTDNILFSFRVEEYSSLIDYPYYILLGVICAIVALYVTKTHNKIEALVKKISNPYKRAIIGGAVLGLIILLFPPLYGEGYNTIKLLIAGESEAVANHSILNFNNTPALILFMLALVFIKAIASAFTTGSGGSGGIFAPSLFIGAVTGHLFAKAVNTFGFFGHTIPATHFTLVGMCGVMSGILHAPLTAIFLIAEITGGYSLFIPLMIVSAFSYLTISKYEPYSLYTKDLVECGDITNDKDKQVLTLMDFHKCIEKDIKSIDPQASLAELVELIKVSNRNFFAVIEECEFMGIIHLNDVRNIMFDPEKQEHIIVGSLMRPVNKKYTIINNHDTADMIVKKFDESKEWNLPVIQDEVYIGFVSKSSFLDLYRHKLIKSEKDFSLER